MRTGELDGIAWSGITEDYTVGWADVTNYFLTNNISGAWCGSYFANTDSWEALPENLKTLFNLCMDSSHYYRQHWYWGGEAGLRVNGPKMKLTTIPKEEWATVEAEAHKFWDEIATTSERAARVVKIFKEYNSIMEKAGGSVSLLVPILSFIVERFLSGNVRQRSRAFPQMLLEFIWRC